MMRTLALVLLTLSLFFSPVAAEQADLVNTANLNPSKLTGKDWLALSRLEKGVFVFSAIQAFKACRVPLNESPDLYAAWMEAELARDSEMQELKAKYILTAMILLREPHCRQAIESLKI